MFHRRLANVTIDDMITSLQWSLLPIISELENFCIKSGIHCIVRYKHEQIGSLGVNLIESRKVCYCDLNEIIIYLYITAREKASVWRNYFEHSSLFQSSWDTIAQNSNSLNFSPSNNVMNTQSTDVGGNLPVSNPVLTAEAGPSAHNNAVGNRFPTPKTDSMTPTRKVADKTQSILFKTKLCKRFMKGLLCFRGKSCYFAHGFDELRLVSHHPQYRTKHCYYISEGFCCPFGEGCFFIHPQ